MATKAKDQEDGVVVVDDVVDVVSKTDDAAGPPKVVETIFGRDHKPGTGASTFAERAKAARAAEKRDTTAVKK